MQSLQIINIPKFIILIDHTGFVFSKKEFSILNRSKKNALLIFNEKNRNLLKITFPVIWNQIIFVKGKVILYTKIQKLPSKKNYLILGSWKKYFYRDLYRFFGFAEKTFHFVGVGYKIVHFHRRKKLRVYFWIGFCTWQVIQLPFFTPLDVHKESFRLLSFRLFASSHKFTKLILLIKNIRLAEPYKGKGIRFMNEKITRKPGKTGRL